MTLKRIIIAATLTLSLAAAAFAEEPSKAPAPGAAPAMSAPAAPGAPAAATATNAVQSPDPASAATPTKQKRELKANKAITISMFAVIIAITMGVVVWAAKQTKTASDFYAAGGGITGTQNGWAIAGDYMSAASFLGISGLISLYGYDGFMYSVGWLVAYITVLLIVAEPCRNAGKYTLGDILSFRTSPKPVRAFAAISTVAVSTFYLTAQMVGAGKLMALLVGIPYKTSIIGVGILMVGYVVFGGMVATTWVQIIKAGLLMSGAALLSVLVMAKAGFNPIGFFSTIVASPDIQDHVSKLVLKEGVIMSGIDAGQRFLEPGLYLKNPLDQISLGMALVLGTAGMPHILMRFFTVPTAQAARKSVIIAMFIIGGFYVLTTLLGFGAAIHLTPQGITSVDPGGNMATLMLAQQMGADIAPVLGDLFLAFLCAVAFATILAVVSGLVLAASAAIAHDIYVNVIKDGHADQHEQVLAARIREPPGRRALAVLAQVQHGRRHLRPGGRHHRLHRTGDGLPQHDLPESGSCRRQEGRGRPGEEAGGTSGRCYSQREGHQGSRQGKGRRNAGRHLHDGTGEAALHAEKPGHRLHPAGLPGRHLRLPRLPEPALGRDVRRGLRPPEHRLGHGQGRRALIALSQTADKKAGEVFLPGLFAMHACQADDVDPALKTQK